MLVASSTVLVRRLAVSLSVASLALSGGFVAACSGGSASPSTAAPTSDAGGDDAASDDAAAARPPDPCDLPDATPAAPCGTLAWTTSSVSSRPRNHHVTAIVHAAAGDFLYAIGGADEMTTFADVDRAPIHDDGSIGAFASAAHLPVGAGGLSGAVAGGVVVVAGGNTGRAISDKAYSAVVKDDGSLAGWKAAGSVGKPRMHSVAFAMGSTVYVLGGFEGDTVWDDAVQATVQPDGTVSAWAPAGTLPGPRSHFGVAVVDRYVYLIGGLAAPATSNPPALPDVTRAKIGDDGTLGEWTPMTPLPAPLSTHATFFYGGYVYAAGGLSTDAQRNYTIEKRVWRAPVNDDRSLGAWEEAAPLRTARAHVHELPVLGRHVYSVGGAIDFALDSTKEVEIGSFE